MKAAQRSQSQVTEDLAPSSQSIAAPQSNSDRILQLEAHRTQEEGQDTEESNLQAEALAHDQSDAENEEPTDQPAETQQTEADPSAAEGSPEDSNTEGSAEGNPADAAAPPEDSAESSDNTDAAPADANGGSPVDTAAQKAPAPELKSAEASSAQQMVSAPLLRPIVSSASPASDPLLTNIWQRSMGASPFHQQFNAQSQIDGLYQYASLAQSELNMEAGNLAAQVDAAIAVRMTTINTAIDTAIGQVRSQFATAREKSVTDITGLRSQITAASDGAMAQLSSSEQQNIAHLDGGFSTAQNNIDPINASMVQAIDAAWSQRVQEIREAGEAQAQVVLRKRDSLQGGWQGGDGIDKDKNDTRRKTASDVAAKYAAEIREKAQMAANELDGGRSQIGSLVQELLSPISGELASQQAQSQSGIVDMAEQARQGIESQKTEALSNVDSLEQSSQGTFQSQEEAAIQQLERTRQACINSLKSAGATMKANILNAASGFGQQYSAMMEQLQLMLSDGGDVPPDDEMSAATDLMAADLEEMQLTQQQAMHDAFKGGMQDLDGIVAMAQGQIQQAVQQILTGLQAASTDISTESQNMSAAYTQSTMDLAGQLGQNMADASNQASESASQSILDTAAMATDPESELMKGLDESKNNVISELQNSAQKAGNEMKSSAESAAAKVKEKPWYKKVWDAVASVASVIATIVVGIVVFVAIAAFCVATFGTGAIALIAIGAIAGAVASVAGKFAGEAVHSLLTLTNKFSDFNSYMRTFFVGAATGALSMGLGAAAPALNATLKLSVTSFGGAFFEQLGDIVFLGENWHWGEFFFTGAFALGLGKAGERLGKSRLSSWTIGRIFPKNGVGNSWNRFQQFASRTPLLKGLNNTQRGALWTNFVKGKVGGTPYDVLNALVISPTKGGIKEGLMGENPGKTEPEQEAATTNESDAELDSSTVNVQE